MSKIKNGGLHQYGAKPLEQQQFGTADVEGVKDLHGHLPGTQLMGLGACGSQPSSRHLSRLRHKNRPMRSGRIEEANALAHRIGKDIKRQTREI